MDKNLSIYSDKSVVDYYRTQSELFASEAHLVERYFPERARLLDIGVGGGRTAGPLSARASEYVGLDYSAAMVDACRARFPGLDFREANAADLSQFTDSSFDCAMFAFNGIDYITVDAQRADCFREIARVLAPGGMFVFSSHNARTLVYRASLADAAPHQVVWRLTRSIYKSIGLVFRNVGSGAYARGEGYIVDPTHGGLETYVSTPATIVPQLAAAGFELVETIGGHYPARASDVMEPWFYYAARKTAS
ncbi:MAG: class I SAM-dependent methyltransferase [Rhodoblastus sp.]